MVSPKRPLLAQSGRLGSKMVPNHARAQISAIVLDTMVRHHRFFASINDFCLVSLEAGESLALLLLSEEGDDLFSIVA